LVGPIVSGIYAGDPEKLSVRSTMPSLVQFERTSGSVVRGFLGRKRDGAIDVSRSRSGVCGFAGGNQTFVDALSSELAGSGYRGAHVTRIRQRGAGFALECEGLPEKTIEAARVIIATPAAAAAELIAPLEPGAAEDLRTIEHPPIAQVALAYPRSSVGVPLDGFGFLACRNEGVRILGAVWNSVMFHDRCPENELLVTAFLGGVTDPSIADCSDEDVARIAHRDLARVMKITEARPRVVAGFRWANAIPQYALGHEERIARIAATVERIPGLTLTGNYFRGAGVVERIRQAYAAADKM
jgi:protoporphyrinogen/coproporphyrinogen III oxidase